MQQANITMPSVVKCLKGRHDPVICTFC